MWPTRYALQVLPSPNFPEAFLASGDLALEKNDYSRGLWWNPSAYELPSHVQGTNLGRSITSNLTTVINPTMTNEFVFALSKLKLDNDYKMYEYACHEGNTAIRNYIETSRFERGQKKTGQ